jgi:molecular chaperone HtpG
VSRQTLQANPVTRRIRKHLVAKVLSGLEEMLRDARADYERFFSAFGAVLKEAIALGEDEGDRVARLCLFESTTQQGRTTLPEYLERIPVSQKAIYVLAGRDRAVASGAPHLEAFRKRGVEVLLLTEPVDEWMLARLEEFGGKPLKAVDQGLLDLEEEGERKVREERETERREFLDAVRAAAGAPIEAVRYSARLDESPAALVAPEGGASPALERALREIRGEDAPPAPRVLELNGEHALVKRLEAAHARAPEGEEFRDLCQVLVGQALLLEGVALPDPAGFSRRLARLLAAPAG